MSVTILPDNAAWHYSPFNWVFSGGTYAQSNTPGAFCEIRFTGTSVSLLVDPSTLSGYASNRYPYFRYALDGGSFSTQQMASGVMSHALGSGLSVGTHFLRVEFDFCDSTGTDRWTIPSEIFRLNGIQLDNGATVSFVSPTARSGVFFGDSIPEAVWDNTSYQTGSSAKTCVPLFAAALSCDIGKICFQGQGYTVGGVGNVPALYTPGDAAATSFDQQSNGVTRLPFSPVPSYVFCWLGTNDNGASDAAVTARVEAWLAVIRGDCVSSQIFVFIPAGQYKRSAITDGVENYQSNNPSDTKVYLIDTGINYADTPAYVIADGVHLTQEGHAAFFADAWPLVLALLETSDNALIVQTSNSAAVTELWKRAVVGSTPTEEVIHHSSDYPTSPIPNDYVYARHGTPQELVYVFDGTITLAKAIASRP